MPEANLPQPPDSATTPPALQADGGRASGSDVGGAPPAHSASPVPPAQPVGNGPERLPYWLRQCERFVWVIVQMYLGLLVCFAPWSPWWDTNPLFASSPHLLAFISNGAVRGVVSGLGLLNLWIALRDALRGPGSESQGPSGR